MLIRTQVLTPVSPEKVEYIPDCILRIENGVIQEILSSQSTDFLPTVDFDYRDCICLPGFIDAHTHLSQHFVKGKHSSNLLDWLNQYIFIEENRAADSDYAEKTARAFFQAQLAMGTTTSVVYVAPYAQACDMAFQVADEMGVRAIIGKTMMDRNAPDFLQEKTAQSLEESFSLYEKWNRRTPLLEYIFTPRFAPVCSSELMRETAAFAQQHQAYIQTHISENPNEVEWVGNLFPNCSSYTDVYAQHGLLGPLTLLGHCIYLSDKELSVFKETGTQAIHCPDSNFFLHSGRFPLEKMEAFQIPFALATDVGAGSSHAMRFVMKMFQYRQDQAVSLEKTLYAATLGGAVTLHKQNEIGSIEVGKQADLAFFSLPPFLDNAQEILAYLIYLKSETPAFAIFINGNKIDF